MKKEGSKRKRQNYLGSNKFIDSGYFLTITPLCLDIKKDFDALCQSRYFNLVNHEGLEPSAR